VGFCLFFKLCAKPFFQNIIDVGLGDEVHMLVAFYDVEFCLGGNFFDAWLIFFRNKGFIFTADNQKNWFFDL
jgi:hypothetical protein